MGTVYFRKKSRCQSCGMPLCKDKNRSQVVGESVIRFCSFCYQDGQFIEPNLSLDEMLTRVKLVLQRQNHSRIIIFFMLRIVKTLERWKTSNLSSDY